MRIGSGGSKVKGKRAAGIFFTDGSSVLMLKRNSDTEQPETWALPAGKAHKGETYINAAIRETKEETGLDSIPGHRFETLESKNGLQTFVAYIYKVGKKFDINITEEHLDWKWVEFSELEKMKLHSNFKKELPRYLKAIRRTQSFKEWAETTQIIESFLH